jgi:hypothetical protein
MKIHYVSCFPPNDAAELPLRRELNLWGDQNNQNLTVHEVTTPDELKTHLLALDKTSLNVLIVGGHGHGSLMGFNVWENPVRWHDLAHLLRGKLPNACTFVFYSCDGGYPGIMHIFGRETGPDLVFGPRIKVMAEAMTHATIEILKWKGTGGGDTTAAKTLIDRLHNWARGQYLDEYDHDFLRVMWSEGQNARYPDQPGPDKPNGTSIPLREWGL